MDENMDRGPRYVQDNLLFVFFSNLAWNIKEGYMLEQDQEKRDVTCLNVFSYSFVQNNCVLSLDNLCFCMQRSSSHTDPYVVSKAQRLSSFLLCFIGIGQSFLFPISCSLVSISLYERITGEIYFLLENAARLQDNFQVSISKSIKNLYKFFMQMQSLIFVP